MSLSIDEARRLFLEADDAELQALASEVRQRFHPPQQATYLIMSIINYTNICIAKCDYCSFYRLPHQRGTYQLSLEEISAKIATLTSFGGTLVAFNGGFNPKLRLSDYAELFATLHQRYPALTFFEMTVAEFMFSCKVSKLSYSHGAALLKQAGTQWVTGGGAEVLSESFRQRHSPGKYRVSDYYQAQSALIRAGIGSTATMVIGFDESLDERFAHLESLKNFQNEHHGALPSFLCWTYKPWNNALGGNEISLQEYLRWLAICRIYLTNFSTIRTSVLTRNEGAFAALTYGANDFDIPLEDEVTQKAGATISLDIASLLSSAENLGFTPLHRPPFKLPMSRDIPPQ